MDLSADPFSDAVDVALLQWPEEERARARLAAVGRPRLLLVAPGGPAPVLLDELEDWLRVPVDPDDLRARTEVLERRGGTALPSPGVTLDDDGLLRVGASWVALSDAQVAVTRVLLHHLERVVSFDALRSVCEAADVSAHPTSIRTLVTRLRTRVREVGLDLVTVRRRGVLLTARPGLGPRPTASERRVAAAPRAAGG